MIDFSRLLTVVEYIHIHRDKFNFEAPIPVVIDKLVDILIYMYDKLAIEMTVEK